MTERKEKNRQKFNERGITLIALVITIIVLLILAGVALSALTGDSGILNNTESAKAETNHKSVAECLKLKMGEYQIEKSANGYDKDFKTFLKENEDGAIIDDNGVINVKKLVGKKLGSGNGSDLNDVYVLEDATEVGEKSYKLKYYRTQTSIVELGEMGEPAKPSKLIITGESEVDVKSTITLSAQPNIGETDAEDIEWTSSKPDVATVENGVVTGVNATKGTTIITAKYNNSLIGTKEITVNPKLLGDCTNCTDGKVMAYKCPECNVVSKSCVELSPWKKGNTAWIRCDLCSELWFTDDINNNPIELFCYECDPDQLGSGPATGYPNGPLDLSGCSCNIVRVFS